jgi:hypothetical protein
VPPVREEYHELFRGKIDLDHLTADAPVVVLLRVVLQQVIGWVRVDALRTSPNLSSSLRPLPLHPTSHPASYLSPVPIPYCLLFRGFGLIV